MAAASSRTTRSSAPALRSSTDAFHHSVPPSGRYCSSSQHHHHAHAPSSSPYAYYYYPSPTSSTSAFASSTSSFSTRSSPFYHSHTHHPHHHRAASPTRVNIVGSAPPAHSVRFAIDPRSISPGRSLTAAPGRDDHHHHHHPHQIVSQHPSAAHQQQRRTCMCSPTTHPGSFRCAIHKSTTGFHHPHAVSTPSNRLNARRSAMTNSLVRIGTVEGDWVRRALAALIRPSSHHQRRRFAFQPGPSRLSVMSMAGEGDNCCS